MGSRQGTRGRVSDNEDDKPEEIIESTAYYRFHMVAVNGENTAERPMWTEKGGLDFEGRAKWDAWAAVKGMKTDKAKLEFVRVRTYILCIPLDGKMRHSCTEF